jgi:hypothetical protein
LWCVVVFLGRCFDLGCAMQWLMQRRLT